MPEPLLLPVSATITRTTSSRDRYDKVLEAYSKPMMTTTLDDIHFGQRTTYPDGVVSDFEFTGLLKAADVNISMDGRGRAFDNIFVERLWRTVKYEDVYLRGYASLGELTVGLADYFQFYNAQRPHQSLNNQTPDAVYHSGKGGGASVPDHFGGRKEAPEHEQTGQRCAAATMAEALT